MVDERTYAAFSGHVCLGHGPLTSVLLAVKRRLDEGQSDSVLLFDDETGTQLDFDLTGSSKDVLERLGHHPALQSTKEGVDPKDRPGPGRPKLGVVGKEVSLLPRHWEWLESQPESASALLRRLVDEARKRDEGKLQATRARDAVGKFMWSIAGNLEGFEEATRSLYAGDWDGVRLLVHGWPVDLKAHIERLLVRAQNAATSLDSKG